MKTVLVHDQPLSGNGNHRAGGKRFGGINDLAA